MTYEVVLTKDAENDLDNFIQYLLFEKHSKQAFNFGRTNVKRNKKQIVDRIHVVVGYRVDTRDTIFFDE